MKKIFLFAFAVILVTSCKKESETEKIIPTEDKQSPTETINQTVCYAYSKDGNIIEMQLQRNGAEASGTLTYALSEKDKNIGTFNGRIEDNVLLADYTFGSEGSTSTRQVAFRLENDRLIEGYGEMTDEGTQFKDASKLEYPSTMPLTKTVCPN